MAESIRLSVYFDVQGGAQIRQGADNLDLLAGQFRSLMQQANGYNRAIRSMVAETNRAASILHSRLNAAMGVTNRLFEESFHAINRLARFGFYKMVLEVGAVGYALRGLAKEFISINEQFAGLQITLKSAFQSAQAARQIREELVKITALSPVPLEDLAAAARSVAVVPQLANQVQVQLQQGTLGDQDGFFRRYMRLTEQMLAFRPDKQVKDVIFSIREAATGELRSLIRRFDFPPGLLVSASGKSINQLRQDPVAMVNAIKAAMDRIITPQAVKELAFLPSKLADNLTEQLLKIPLLRIGDAGFFKTFTGFFDRVYTQVSGFTQTQFDKPRTGQGGEQLPSYAKQISDSVSELFFTVINSTKNLGEALLKRVGFGIEDQPGLTFLERMYGSIAAAADKAAEKLPEVIAGAKDLFEKVTPLITSLGKAMTEALTVFAKLVDGSPVRLLGLYTIWRSLPALFARITGVAATGVAGRFASTQAAIHTPPPGLMLTSQGYYTPAVGAAAAGGVTAATQNTVNQAATRAATSAAAAATTATLTSVQRTGAFLPVGAAANLRAAQTQNAALQGALNNRLAILQRFGNVRQGINANNPNVVSFTPRQGRSTFVNLASGQLPAGLTSFYQRNINQAGYGAGGNLANQFYPVPMPSLPPGARLGPLQIAPSQVGGYLANQQTAWQRALQSGRARQAYQAQLQTALSVGAGGLTGNIASRVGLAALGAGASAGTAGALTSATATVGSIVSSMVIPALVIIAASSVIGLITGAVSKYVDAQRSARQKEYGERTGYSKGQEERIRAQGSDINQYVGELNQALSIKGIKLNDPEFGAFLLDPANVLKDASQDFTEAVASFSDAQLDSIKNQKLTATALEKVGGSDLANARYRAYAVGSIGYRQSEPFNVTLDQWLNRFRAVSEDFANLRALALGETSNPVKVTSALEEFTVRNSDEAAKFADILDIQRKAMESMLQKISKVTEAKFGAQYTPTLSPRDIGLAQFAQRTIESVSGPEANFNTQIGFLSEQLKGLEDFRAAIQTYKVPEARAAIVAQTESYWQNRQNELAYGETTAAAFSGEMDRVNQLARIRSDLTSTATPENLRDNLEEFIKRFSDSVIDPEGDGSTLLPGLKPREVEATIAKLRQPDLIPAAIKDLVSQVDYAMTAGLRERVGQVAQTIDVGFRQLLDTESTSEIERISATMNEGIDAVGLMLENIAAAVELPGQYQEQLDRSIRGIREKIATAFLPPTAELAPELLPASQVARSQTAKDAVDSLRDIIKGFGEQFGLQDTAAKYEQPLELLSRGFEQVINVNTEKARQQSQSVIRRNRENALTNILGGGDLGLDTTTGREDLNRQLELFGEYLDTYRVVLPKRVTEAFRDLANKGLGGLELEIELNRLRQQTANILAESAQSVPDMLNFAPKLKRLIEPSFKAWVDTLTGFGKDAAIRVAEAEARLNADVRRSNAGAYQEVLSGTLFPGGFGALSQEARAASFRGYETYLSTYGINQQLSPEQMAQLQATPIDEPERLRQFKTVLDVTSQTARVLQSRLDAGVLTGAGGTRALTPEERGDYEQAIADSWERAKGAARNIADVLTRAFEEGTQALNRLGTGQYSTVGSAAGELIQADLVRARATLTRRGYTIPSPLQPGGSLGTFDTSRLSGQRDALLAGRETYASLATQTRQRRDLEVDPIIKQSYQLEYEELLRNIQQIDTALLGIEGKGNTVFSTFADGFGRVTDQWYATVNNLTQIGEQFASSLSSNFGSAWGSWISGAQSGEEAFRSFVSSVLQGLAQMLMQKAFEGILGSVFNALMPTSSVVPASIGSGLGAVGNVAAAPASATASFTQLAGFGVARSGGGVVPGGPSDIDSVHIFASPGEVVIPTKAVRRYGMDHFRQYFQPATQMATGGVVGGGYNLESPAYTRFTKEQPTSSAQVNAPVNVNVTINKDGTSETTVEGASERARTLGASIQLLVRRTMMEEQRQGGIMKR